MTTDIRQLLDKYFNGDTTVEEEKALRRYFTRDDVPGDMQVYAPIFHFLDDESVALAALNEIRNEGEAPVRRKRFLLRKLWAIAAVAAVLIIAVLLPLRRNKSTKVQNENYAWVDGQLITDPEAVREYMEVSFGNVQSDRDIVEEQLLFMFKQ